MFSFDTTTSTRTSNNSGKKYAQKPKSFGYGLLGKLSGYSFVDNRANFEFTLDNGAILKKSVFSPVNTNGETKESKIDLYVNTIKKLAAISGINKDLKGTTDTWESFCNAFFLGEDFTNTNVIRLKVGYAKAIHNYDPSKFVGKSQEEIKTLTHPFINITQGILFFGEESSSKEFEFNDFDKVVTDYELLEMIPTADIEVPAKPTDDLPF